MAKGQLRSNREPKKPKQAKPKPAAPGSTFGVIAALKPGGASGGKKR
jgi:hypothetical protein